MHEVQPPAATTPGITAAIVGMSDPQPHLRLWQEVFGFVELGRGVVESDTARALYGVEGPVEVRSLAAPTVKGGGVHLLHLPHVTETPLHRSFWETGVNSLDVMVRGFDVAEEALAAAGLAFREPPRDMNLELESETVHGAEAALMLPPDQAYLQFGYFLNDVGLAGDALELPDRVFSEITSILVTAADVDAEIGFWTAFGYGVWDDTTLCNPNLEYFLSVPQGAPVRLATIGGQGPAALELVGLPPHYARSRVSAPIGHALGLAGVSIEVPDLSEAIASVAADTPTIRVDTPLHGRADVTHLMSPAGVAVELFQAVDD